MKTIQGPGIFLAQFIGTAAPFDTLDGLAGWAASLGYRGVQIPTSDAAIFDLERAATSDTYCDEVKGRLAAHGLQITELSTHLQGQLLCVHPAYDLQFDAFAAPQVRGNPTARTAWAHEQLLLAAKASRRLGLKAHASFSGALAWPYLYPWPQRPPGLVEAAFAELAKRWRPVLDAFDEAGVDVATNCTPAKTCTTASPSSVFSTPWASTRARTSSTTPATSCCSSSTTWPSSTTTTSASAPST